MIKFKVGDRAWAKSNVEGIEGNGTIAEIETTSNTKMHHRVCYDLPRILLWSLDDSIRFLEDDLKIVITHKDNITLARMMDGKKVVKSAEAKCAPDDTYDFATGAGLAFDRLMGREKVQDKPEPEQPKYWSGKVVCVDDESAYFTVGKVYAFKNGVVSDDDGDVYNHIYPAKTVAEALKRKKVKFLEYKGEAK